MSFLASMEAQILGNLASLATAFSANLSSASRPLFVSAATIYITMIGYDVAWGKSEDSISYIMTKLGKFMIIGTFAVFGWDSLAYPFFSGLPAWFLAATTGTSGIAAVLETYIWTPILNVWISVFNSALNMLNLANLAKGFWEGTAVIVMPLVGLFAGVVLIAVGVLLSCVGFVMYAMPLTLLYVTLALGPFFLMCAAFPVTQRYFESWVNAVMTMSLAMTLVSITVVSGSAMLGLTAWASSGSFPASGVTFDPNYGIVGAIFGHAFMALILTFIFKKVADLAASLGGGMNFGGTLQGLMRAVQGKQRRDPPAPRDPNTIDGGKGGDKQPTLRQSAQQALANGARRVGSGVARVGYDGAQVVSHAYNRATKNAIRRYGS